MSTDAKLFSTGEVADQLGLARWKLQYLIERGDLPQPAQSVAGRRLFTAEEIDQLKQQLAKRREQKAAEAQVS